MPRRNIAAPNYALTKQNSTLLDRSTTLQGVTLPCHHWAVLDVTVLYQHKAIPDCAIPMLYWTLPYSTLAIHHRDITLQHKSVQHLTNTKQNLTWPRHHVTWPYATTPRQYNTVHCDATQHLHTTWLNSAITKLNTTKPYRNAAWLCETVPLQYQA
mgnify:CR=1 FL=1